MMRIVSLLPLPGFRVRRRSDWDAKAEGIKLVVSNPFRCLL